MDTSDPARILVVEDDVPTASAIVRALKGAGFEVELAVDGILGLEAIRRARFDLVVLDLRLPRAHGLALLEALRGAEGRARHNRDSCVLVISASTELASRLRSFELGADDFVPKPFWTEELLARIRRRLGRPDAVARNSEIGILTVDPRARQVRVAGREVALTGAEFDLLCVLVRARGGAVSRAQLAEEVLAADADGRGRTVDSHVARLRRKLGDAGGYVRTVWGIGYRLSEENQ